MIDTQNHKEAFAIKNFIAKKSKIAIRPVKKAAQYDPTKFFTAITTEKGINDEIKLLTAGFRKLNIGDYTMNVKETAGKNDIIHVINWMKNQGILKLNDFSEFENLVFSSKGIRYTIVIHENNWGQLKLKIIDKNKPAKELLAFQHAFEKAYGIPFEATLRHQNETTDRIAITRKLLDNKTIKAEMPQEVEDIILDLMERKFLSKPVSNTKRRCIKCHHIFWTKGDCPLCGNQSYFDGEYLDIEVDDQYFQTALLQSLRRTKRLTATKTTRQIAGKKHVFIEVIDKDGDFLSIYVSRSNVPVALLDEFERNGNPLLFVLMKYKNAVYEDLTARNFECLDFAELVQGDINNFGLRVLTAIQNQKNKWRTKLITKGWNSYLRLKAKSNAYSDQDFEADIYNILHEIFNVADRMGGKFTGVKAPDAIVSLQNYSSPRKRFCMAWDCKYSVNPKGYQLNDKPEKHRQYLYKLAKHEKVNFFGGLNTYAVISQNMDKGKYAKFYQKLIYRSRWKGKIVLLEEQNLLLLYKVFKDNEELIYTYPKFFFSKVFNLFKATPLKESAPFPVISNERILAVFDRMKTEFKAAHQQFKFKREDFN